MLLILVSHSHILLSDQYSRERTQAISLKDIMSREVGHLRSDIFHTWYDDRHQTKKQTNKNKKNFRL